MILLTDEEINRLFDNISPLNKIDVTLTEVQLELLEKEVIRACGIVCKAQLKKVVEWGDEPCPHLPFFNKRTCAKCWQTLLEEVK